MCIFLRRQLLSCNRLCRFLSIHACVTIYFRSIQIVSGYDKCLVHINTDRTELMFTIYMLIHVLYLFTIVTDTHWYLLNKLREIFTSVRILFYFLYIFKKISKLVTLFSVFYKNHLKFRYRHVFFKKRFPYPNQFFFQKPPIFFLSLKHFKLILQSLNENWNIMSDMTILA